VRGDILIAEMERVHHFSPGLQTLKNLKGYESFYATNYFFRIESIVGSELCHELKVEIPCKLDVRIPRKYIKRHKVTSHCIWHHYNYDLN
jgi:hypothetical protein